MSSRSTMPDHIRSTAMPRRICIRDESVRTELVHSCDDIRKERPAALFKTETIKHFYNKDMNSIFGIMGDIEESNEKESRETFVQLLKKLLDENFTIEMGKVEPEDITTTMRVQCRGEISMLIEFKKKLNFKRNKESCVTRMVNLARDSPHLQGFHLVYTDGMVFYPFLYYFFDGRPVIAFEDHVTLLLKENTSGEKVVNSDGIKYFLELIHTVPRSTATLNFATYSDSIYTATSIIGVGASSTVFICTRSRKAKTGHSDLGSPDLTKYKEFAVKKMDLNELNKEFGMNLVLAKKRITPPILDYQYENGILVYPICSPVVRSIWTLDYLVQDLTEEHFRQLFAKLKQMHKLGILHRDIRPENIVVFENEAYFIDFGSSVKKSNDEEQYCGTLTTASQRVLSFLAEGRTKFVYTASDDIESFCKTFKWHHGIGSQHRFVKSEKINAKRLLEMWANFNDVKMVQQSKTYASKCRLVYKHFFKKQE